MLGLKPEEYAFVAKVNVSNIDQSVAWYEKLGMREDKRFRESTWAQMNFNGLRQVAIGLNLSGDTGTDTSVSTIVVDDIEKARQYLLGQGIAVGEIASYDGVKMCYFRDPDCNRLGLRQNPPSRPCACECGCE